MRWFKGVTPSEVTAAIDAAKLQGAQSALFAAHLKQCEEDKAELRHALKHQDTQRLAMHNENQKQFNDLHNRISLWSWRIILGVIMAEGALITAMWAMLEKQIVVK